MSVVMIGLDTARAVFQAHGVNEAGQVKIRRKLRREELVAFFEKLDACTVVLWKPAVRPTTGLVC
jgi:transposase